MQLVQGQKKKNPAKNKSWNLFKCSKLRSIEIAVFLKHCLVLYCFFFFKIDGCNKLAVKSICEKMLLPSNLFYGMKVTHSQIFREELTNLNFTYLFWPQMCWWKMQGSNISLLVDMARIKSWNWDLSTLSWRFVSALPLYHWVCNSCEYVRSRRESILVQMLHLNLFISHYSIRTAGWWLIIFLCCEQWSRTTSLCANARHLCSSLVMRAACNEHSFWEDGMSGHAASQNPHTLIHTPYFQYSLVFLGCCRLAIYDSPITLWDWPFSNTSNCFISLCVIFLDIRLGCEEGFQWNL